MVIYLLPFSKFKSEASSLQGSSRWCYLFLRFVYRLAHFSPTKIFLRHLDSGRLQTQHMWGWFFNLAYKFSVNWDISLPRRSQFWAVNRLTYSLLTPWSRVLEKLTSKLCSSSGNSPHLWNPKFPHRTHKCPPPVPILSQLHQVPTTPLQLLEDPS
jgi:hypothetical protein